MSSSKLDTGIDPAVDGFNDLLSALLCTQALQVIHLYNTKVLLFHFTGHPSPPRTPSYTVQQYSRDSMMLSVQWQSPQDDGGAPVSYTLTVSPGSTQVTTTATSARDASLSAVPYNVNNTVSIVATNCSGSSSAAMETIRIS